MVTSYPSATSEVIGWSAIPHGTMWSNQERSVVTLRPKPWVVRPRDVRTPMAATFLGPSGPVPGDDGSIHTPGYESMRPTRPAGTPRFTSASITTCSTWRTCSGPWWGPAPTVRTG